MEAFRCMDMIDNKMNKRKLDLVYTPASQNGFLGSGHIARPLIERPFSESDPFILLMDDMFDKKDSEPVGGPHPHAGFETVSLLLEGEIGEDLHGMGKGDFEMMTAGSGIIHTETISKPTRIRLLQLWLNLPQTKRNALPRVQTLKSERVPFSSSHGVGVKVYSGSFAGLISPIKNHTPIIIADITMEANSVTTQQLPANFSTFIYIIDGSLQVGEELQSISRDQVGWLNRSTMSGDSELMLSAGDNGARLILYSAEPQHHEIISHGPFIADTTDDIQRLYSDFRKGKMKHILEVPEEFKMNY